MKQAKHIQRRSIKMHTLLNSFFFFCKPTGKPTDREEHSARQKIPRQKIPSGLYMVIFLKSFFYYPQALVMIWYMLFVLTTKPMHAIWCHSQSNACHLISRPNQWMPLTANPMHGIWPHDHSNACHLISQSIQCMPFDLTTNQIHDVWSHGQFSACHLILQPI